MKAKTILSPIFIALLFFGSLQVQAQNRNYNGPRNGNSGFERQDCRIPDLSDEQEAQITELRNAHFAEVKDLRAELDILRAQKRKLMIADNPDAKAIDAKIDEMSSIQTQMQKLRVAHHLAVRNLLTAEQKVYYDMHHGNRQGKAGRNDNYRRDRGGRGMHGGGYGLRDGSCRN